MAIASLDTFIEKIKKNRETPSVVYIREKECIGCTKCIKACPIDTIIGAAKQTHTVLKKECTGCHLCITACPVDCIEVSRIEKPYDDLARAKQHYEKKALRLEKNKKHALQNKKQIENKDKKRAYIQAAVLRAKEKRRMTITDNATNKEK